MPLPSSSATWQHMHVSVMGLGVIIGLVAFGCHHAATELLSQSTASTTAHINKPSYTTLQLRSLQPMPASSSRVKVFVEDFDTADSRGTLPQFQGGRPGAGHKTQGNGILQMVHTAMRLLLVIGGCVVAWRDIQRHSKPNWAMASTGNPDDGRSSSLRNLDALDALLGAEDVPSSAPKSNAPAEPKPAVEIPKAKSTLLSLQELLGEDPATDASPPAKDAPPTIPTVGATEQTPLSRDEKAKVASDQLYKKLSTIQSEKDVEDIRLQTKELVDLVTMRSLQRRVPPEDVRRMKEVLKRANFWLTSTEDALEYTRTGFVGGHLFRGHLRGDAAKIVAEVLHLTKETFQNKYEVIVIPEPPKYDEEFWQESEENKANPAFLLISAEEVAEAPVRAVQYGLAVLLAVIALTTIYFTAFGVGLTDLDARQIQALVDSENSEALQKLLESNLGTITQLAFPVGVGIAASAVAHEIAQRFAAAKYKVKLSLPYFLPSLSIGTFGAVTRLRSLAPNKSALFDIAASGPVAGASSALGFLFAGILLTKMAATGDPTGVPIGVPVPDELLNSSLILGNVLRALLGPGALQCHPFVLAGWCGLIANALNTLPLGSTDGGRVMQSAFGRGPKQIASFFSYVLLALDVLAPGVGFTWGITTLFLQRGTERNVQDQFTAVDSDRRNVAIVMLILAALVLIPSPSFFTDLPMIN